MKNRMYKKQKGICAYCDGQMIHPAAHVHVDHQPAPLNLATLEHTISRLDPRRRVGVPVKKLLVCWLCNMNRNVAEQAALPIEELRRRSQRGGDGAMQSAMAVGE